MTEPPIRIVPFGDSGVILEVGEELDARTTRRVHQVANAVRERLAGQAGWSKPVPAAASVLVPVDAIEPGVERAIEVLRPIVADLTPDDSRDDPATVRHEIPTRYGGTDGPDLAVVAAAHGLTEDQVV